MTDICWPYWEADDIVFSETAQKKPWIRFSIIAALSLRKVVACECINPGSRALCLNDCRLIHLRSRTCGTISHQGNHQPYAEAALCTGFIVYYMKIVFKAFVLMKPVIISSVKSVKWQNNLSEKGLQNVQLKKIWTTCWFICHLFKFFSRKLYNLGVNQILINWLVLEQQSTSWLVLFTIHINQPNYYHVRMYNRVWEDSRWSIL